jgi:ribonuclease R
LDGVYVEGLVHVTELGNDYFHYDKARHEMAGERTGVRYRLGDRLTIKVVRVDLETTKIDFTLASKTLNADQGSLNDSIAGESFDGKIEKRSTLKLNPLKQFPFDTGVSHKPGRSAGAKGKGSGKSSGKSKTSSKTGTAKSKSAGKKTKRSGR